MRPFAALAQVSAAVKATIMAMKSVAGCIGKIKRRNRAWLSATVRPHGGNLMQIRRAEATDEEALAHIRRSAILALAVPAMSMEQAEKWATRAPMDRIAQAIGDHDVWVAVEGAAIGWVEVDRDRVAALYVSPSCCR